MLKRKTPLRSHSTLKAKKALKRTPFKPKGVDAIAKLLGEGVLRKASSISKKPRKPMNKKGKDEYSLALDAADTAFSRKVRLEAAYKNGFLDCFICNRHLHWKEAVLMHVFTRKKMSVRFHQYNRAGCSDCNDLPLGDRENYINKLTLLEGAKDMENFVLLSNETHKYSAAELWRMADEWEKEAQELESRL